MIRARAKWRMSGRWLRMAAVVCLATAATATSAQEVLTLPQALRQALAVNPSARAQQYGVERQDRERAIARGGFLPKVDVNADVSHYNEPNTVHPIHEAGVFPPLDDDIYGMDVTLRQPLYAGGRLVAGREAAEHNYMAARERLRLTHHELLFQVTRNFADALRYRHLVESLDRRIQALETEREHTAKRLAQGRAARLDLIRLETRLSQARHDRIAARQREQDARARLAALLDARNDLPPLGELSPAGAKVPASMEEALTTASANNPTLNMRAAQTRAARERVNVARADRRPQVELQASVRETSGDNWDFHDDERIGVVFSLPVFDGAVRKNRVAQSELERQQSEFELKAARNDLVAEVHQAVGGVAEAESRRAIARQQQDEAAEALRIESLRYRQGASDISDLLSAEADYWGAVANRLQAEYGFIVAQARLLKATGELRPASFLAAGVHAAQTADNQRAALKPVTGKRRQP